MGVKSDKWIRRMAQDHGMITPFEPGQVKAVGPAVNPQTGQVHLGPCAADLYGAQKIVSYGTSSYGYDVRCGTEFKIFTNINSTVIDPKNFDERNFVNVTGESCIIPPNSFALGVSLERFKIPRDVLTICLGKSTYARCFSGDTRIALVDGTSPTFLEMMARVAGGERLFGYSVDSAGQIYVAELTAPRLIGHEELVEVTLDNGDTIQCTPDHEFLRRDGSLSRADALTPGSSLMPLYRSVERGYEAVWQQNGGGASSTHWLADEWNLRHSKYVSGEREHRHHVDRDKANNNPWNIVRLPASEHTALHNSEYYGDGFDRAAHSSAIKAAFDVLRADDERYATYCDQQAVKAQNYANDPKHSASRAARQAKLAAYWSTEEARAEQAVRQAAYWEGNVEARASAGRHSRKAWEEATDLRRSAQASHARSLKLRADITEEAVGSALQCTGSIRGASKLLKVDRSAFRRFPHLIEAFHAQRQQNHKVVSVRRLAGIQPVYCLTAPEFGNFALEAGVFVKNCGIIVNVTPLEPEWEGHITMEFSNTTPLPARIYANEGCAQLLFLGADLELFAGAENFERKTQLTWHQHDPLLRAGYERQIRRDVCETSYADRGGKYQNQVGVTLPSV